MDREWHRERYFFISQFRTRSTWNMPHICLNQLLKGTYLQQTYVSKLMGELRWYHILSMHGWPLFGLIKACILVTTSRVWTLQINRILLWTILSLPSWCWEMASHDDKVISTIQSYLGRRPCWSIFKCTTYHNATSFLVIHMILLRPLYHVDMRRVLPYDDAFYFAF